MSKIVVRSQYSKEAHKKFYWFHTFKKSASTYIALGLQMIVAAYLAYVAFMTTKTEFKSESPNYLVPIITWVMVILIIVVVISSFISRASKAIESESKNREDSIEIIEVTKNLVSRRYEGHSGREVHSWGDIHAIYEVEDYIYIYTENKEGFIITKADITVGDVKSFRRLAKSSMTPNKRGKVKYKIKYSKNE